MMVVLLSVFAGVVLGSFLQVRALGSQDIWADMRRIVNAPNPLNANPTNHTGDPIQGDAFHRLTKYPNKTEVGCPKQTERTMVLLISGQSNSANHGGQRYASQYGDKVLNYFDGKCYVAKSPLLGATGLEGDSWTFLGNLLIQQGVADQVIIAPTGIAGSAISQWEVGSPYQQMLQSSAQKLLSQYRVTHMLWHQGETDYGKHTSQADYEKLFTGIVDALRQGAPGYADGGPVAVRVPQIYVPPVGRSNEETQALLREVLAELRAQRSDDRARHNSLAEPLQRMDRRGAKWDRDGLPAECTNEAIA